LAKFTDLTGLKFGKLTVIKKTIKPENLKNKGSYWLCQCDCKNNKLIIVGTGALKSGNTKSCGCIHSEKTKELNKITKKKYNTYDISGDYGVGYTSNGKVFYFDLEDYEKIKNYSWHIDNKGYVINSKNENEKICFHRLVMNCLKDEIIDHINGYKTRNDNRKNNLRICNYLKNAWNRKIPSNNTSGCSGVYKFKNKWVASICVNWNKINLGTFKNIDEAIKTRKEAEIKYFKEYRFKEDKIIEKE
jgi:hypothetical protein